MPGLKDWFPVFKAGKQTDSKGREHFFTTDDLDKVVQNYQSSNSNFQEAPIVLGHPQDTAPAFGWLEGFKREGDILFCKCKDVVAEFEDMVSAGLYPNRSISLNPDMTVNHLGFLGAVQPAVKGLGKIQFSQNADSMVFNFMDWKTASNLHSVGDLFQGLRDFLIEKYDLATADRLLSQFSIDYLKQAKADDIPQEVAAFCQKIKEEITLKTSGKEVNPQANEFSQADYEAQSNENKALKAEVERLKSETRKNEFSAFCDGLVEKGQLTPAQKAQASDFMEVMHNAGEFEFSDGGKQSVVEKFQQFLSKLPVQVNFSEVAKGNILNTAESETPKNIAKKALEFQQAEAKEGRIIRIDEAVRSISNQK